MLIEAFFNLKYFMSTTIWITFIITLSHIVTNLQAKLGPKHTSAHQNQLHLFNLNCSLRQKKKKHLFQYFIRSVLYLIMPSTTTFDNFRGHVLNCSTEWISSLALKTINKKFDLQSYLTGRKLLHTKNVVLTELGAENSLLSPKSVITTCPSESNRMFSNLMSR